MVRKSWRTIGVVRLRKREELEMSEVQALLLEAAKLLPVLVQCSSSIPSLSSKSLLSLPDRLICFDSQAVDKENPAKPAAIERKENQGGKGIVK